MQEEYQPLMYSLSEIALMVPKVDGIETGLGQIDRLTGGLRPNKLNFVVGYSSHGKTALMMRTQIHNIDNKNLKCLHISGDDTQDILLGKFIAMREGISTEDVDSYGPEWRNQYQDLNLKKNLIIAAVRDSYTTADIERALEEASYRLSEINGELSEPDIVVFDYTSMLKLRASDSESTFNDVNGKVYAIKNCIRRHPGIVWMIGHQCRKSAEDARALTLNDLEYGGHQQADGVVIGCRRDNMATMAEDKIREEQLCPKVYVSVMKNKITGRKSPNPVGYPYLIDPISGGIREIQESDKPYSIGNPMQPIKPHIVWSQPPGES